jgi:hypothetical protein
MSPGQEWGNAPPQNAPGTGADSPAPGLHFSIRQYKLFGIATYYGFIGFFELMDRHYHTDGAIAIVGYCYGVAALVLSFVASTGEQTMAAIKAELHGPPPATLSELLWSWADGIAFWLAVIAGVYFFFRARIWDGLVSLGYPVWRLWLLLEMRRLRIKSGETKPSFFWKAALGASFALVLFSLLLMLTGGYGPYKDFGWGAVQLYPVIFIAAIVCCVLSLIGTAGEF